MFRRGGHAGPPLHCLPAREDHLPRVPLYDRPLRNRPRDHRVGGEDGTAPHVGAVEEDAAGADPDVAADTDPLRRDLLLETDGHVQPVIAVVVADDRDVGADQAVVADLDSLGMRGEDAAVGDLHVGADRERPVRGLDLGERADDGPGADLQEGRDLHLGPGADLAAELQPGVDRHHEPGDQEPAHDRAGAHQAGSRSLTMRRMVSKRSSSPTSFMVKRIPNASSRAETIRRWFIESHEGASSRWNPFPIALGSTSRTSAMTSLMRRSASKRTSSYRL